MKSLIVSAFGALIGAGWGLWLALGAYSIPGQAPGWLKIAATVVVSAVLGLVAASIIHTIFSSSRIRHVHNNSGL